MNSINLISKHLDENNLSIEVHDVDAVCAFTGEQISRGVKNKDLIKKTFTDWAYLKYRSDFSSVDAALCIEAVIKSEKGFNSLRNYSFFATESELVFLRREDILDLVLSVPSTPFVLCVTYSNKKHTAYKATVNYNQKNFIVTTDIGDVNIDIDKVRSILPIIQSWYTVVRGKEETSAQPTYFTKAEILNGCDNHKRINDYGIEKYYKENEIIEQYRNTAFLNFIVHILNKSNA